MNTKQRAIFYHEFSKLLGAGLHIDRSVALLLEQSSPVTVKAFLKNIQRGLDERLGLADAIEKYNVGQVSSLEANLLQAGERGGRLEVACAHLAQYFELRQKSREKVIGAMIYPLIMLHLGVVLPDLPTLIAGGNPGDVLSGLIFRLLFVWIAIVALMIFSGWLFRAGARSSAIDGFLRSLPLVGSVRKNWAMARFCQVFEMGLLAALKMSESLLLAGEASQSAVLANASKRAAKNVADGAALAGSLRKTGGFSVTFVNAMETGEQSGTLDLEMARWAKIQSERAAESQDRASEWLPRLFYIGVVFYIAARIVSQFAGYTKQMSNMLDGF